MKLILTIFVVLVLLAGASNAAGVLDLSTLNKNTTKQTIALPQVSPTMPTIAPTTLGGNVESNVLDLSSLGKKVESKVSATLIKGPTPITVTPMFSVKNTNVTTEAGTVFTLPQAISANATVYTPPIAIFGGA
ncbi:MAG: hypothetical protein A4E44_00367 [Methanosaeta sp. PtaB.Bin018]|jgi:hypothetical protein|nr:hypothetical protein [Methanothrix sp.]OPX76780.1 MAG: hypothetical protein A4E44_00367 [Methanosaeta sp. PtaB.Bin018]OPY46951.1 MAG: hypothetical protein A4E46_00715 [Methanosaeta sp. PtaU1.Bin016]HOV51344.1 hypothetical protein [Methanothrix sp.]